MIIIVLTAFYVSMSRIYYLMEILGIIMLIFQNTDLAKVLFFLLRGKLQHFDIDDIFTLFSLLLVLTVSIKFFPFAYH